VWDLHWHVLECQRREAAADLSGAMAAAIERVAGEGWQAEATPEYGFVFIRCAGERRLLMLTPGDPYSTMAQSFNPFAPRAKVLAGTCRGLSERRCCCQRFGCSAAQLRTGNADVDIGAAGWLVLRTFHHLLRLSRTSPQIILSYSLTRILYLNYGDSWDK
jgi:hypothetical protein